jgi:putative phage-type endonuclease
MKIIRLKQTSPRWHKWRAKGIGGSDASAVMGESGWTSPDELLAEKLGLRTVEENERMARGRRLEPEARARYCREYGIKMTPVCVSHDEYPWLRASLDGWNDEHRLVLEIKCPGYWTHVKALRGYVPDYYTAQVQHQLLVTGADRLHYASYFPDTDDSGRSFPDECQLAVVEVRPDPVYQDRLLEAERAFVERQKEAKAALARQRKEARAKKGRRGKNGGKVS